MVANILIGAAIFGYAGWALARFINKSKKGKCAACELSKTCSGGCSLPANRKMDESEKTAID